MSTLREIEAAKVAVDEASAAYRQAVVDAVENGVPISKAARAAGVTRSTVYYWIEDAKAAESK